MAFASDTIGGLFARTIEGQALGYGNAATVYPLADSAHYVLRVPHDMRASFKAILQGSTPFTPLDRFYETGVSMPFNAGQPLLLVMLHGYKRYTGVTVSLRSPGVALDAMKRENGHTSWRMMEMFMAHAALPKWKGAFEYLIDHYSRIRHARLDVDCQGNNIMVDLQNVKMRFVDILSDEKSSLADAFCNIVIGSHAVRMDEVVLGAEPRGKVADLPAYKDHCRTILGWMLSAAETSQLPFILKKEESCVASQSVFYQVLTKHCGFDGAALQEIRHRIEATYDHIQKFRGETDFDKEKRFIAVRPVEPSLGYDSHADRLEAYLEMQRQAVLQRC